MPVYTADDYFRNEKNLMMEWLRRKLAPLIPQILLPPTMEETIRARGQIITDKPTPEGTYLPFAPKINLEALAKYIWGVTAKLAESPGLEFVQPLQIKAFHGSPYKFTKFKNEAIGTGEGAQAFGYGHYLTESPEVARQYALIGPRGVSSADLAGRIMNLTKGNKEEAIQILRDRYIKGTPEAETTHLEHFNEAIKHIKNDTYTGNFIYETTIHKGKKPGEYTYLEWDKAIPQNQIDNIVREFQKLPKELRQRMYADMDINTTAELRKIIKEDMDTGDRIYRTFEVLLGSDKEASAFLNRAGFSGIKYPTGSLSGIKGSKEYNYVVFNPEDITIEAMK